MGKYLTLILAFLLLIAAFLYFDAKQETKAAKGLITGLNKDLKITRNKLGEAVTQVNDIKVVRDELLGITGLQERQLLRLQEVVKRNRKATGAVVFTALTEGTASGKTTDIRYVDRVETDTVYAEYSGTVANDNIEATITANRDSVWLNSYKVYNDFEVVQTFDKKTAIVQVTAKNKASKVIDMRSWSKPLPKQRTGLKLLGGAALGIAGTLFIFKGF